MKLKFFTILFFTGFLISACSFAKTSAQNNTSVLADGSVIKATLGEKEFNFIVANTPKAKAKGLSGIDSIPEDGMIFFFFEPATFSFWMKDMRFPIDIIWVSDDNKVSGIEENVPVAEEGISDLDLPKYFSKPNTKIVIELNAGDAKKYGITEGSVFEIH